MKSFPTSFVMRKERQAGVMIIPYRVIGQFGHTCKERSDHQNHHRFTMNKSRQPHLLPFGEWVDINLESARDLVDLELVRYLSETLPIAFWARRKTVVWLYHTGRLILFGCSYRLLEGKVLRAGSWAQIFLCCLLEINSIPPQHRTH